MTRILGILNLTRDSFSDGGRFLDSPDAVSHGHALAAAGAWAIDLGAESTHPDAEEVSTDEEIRRLEAVGPALKRQGLRISVDTYKPDVMRAALAWGADLINDVTGMRAPEAIDAVAAADCGLIVMYARAAAGKAERAEGDPDTILDEIEAWFADRLAALAAAGVAPERVILDPGMGFFLGSNAEVSVRVLRHLPRLAATFGLPLLISTSRKSVIGSLLEPDGPPRPVDQRGAGTLASEIFAALQGCAYIRTHDVQALADALRVLVALRG